MCWQWGRQPIHSSLLRCHSHSSATKVIIIHRLVVTHVLQNFPEGITPALGNWTQWWAAQILTNKYLVTVLNNNAGATICSLGSHGRSSFGILENHNYWEYLLPVLNMRSPEQTWGGLSPESFSPTMAVAILTLAAAVLRTEMPLLWATASQWRDPHSPKQALYMWASPGRHSFRCLWRRNLQL